LKEFFNVSDVELTSKPIVDSDGQPPFNVRPLDGFEFLPYVELASGHKCARCWNFMPEVSNYGIWQNVCTRCSDALTEMKIAPPKYTEAK
jgi:hypothetical protein